MIKIYRVANGEDLDVQGEREKANNSFTPSFVHIRDEDGGYFVAVLPADIHEDFILMDSSDPDYEEIHDWVTQDGFTEKMFDPEITDTVN